MLLKTSNGKPIDLYFLTSEMVDLLKRESIRLQNVSKIAAYHQKLTASEIANIINFQFIIGKILGVRMKGLESFIEEGFEGKMIEQAFNAIDSETLRKVAVETKHFSSIEAGDNVVILAFKKEDEDIAGWDSLQNQTFSGALLETIFAKVGYIEAHYGKAVNTAIGEVSLAEVYKLVSLETP